jgi:hypothetical protein
MKKALTVRPEAARPGRHAKKKPRPLPNPWVTTRGGSALVLEPGNLTELIPRCLAGVSMRLNNAWGR